MYVPKKRMDFLQYVIPDEHGNKWNGTLMEDVPDDVREEWERYQKAWEPEKEKMARGIAIDKF